MSDSRDLLDKADALLSRYRDTGLADVPVLTEVVDIPPPLPAHAGPSRQEAPQDSLIQHTLPLPAGPQEAGFQDAEVREVEAQEVRALQIQLAWRDAVRPELEALEQRLHERMDRLMAEFSERVAEAIDDEVRAFRAEALKGPQSEPPR
jgi:hypothetical protein